MNSFDIQVHDGQFHLFITLAMAGLCKSWNYLIAKVIKCTAEAAHRHHCRVSICGELGSDPAMTETLLRMGLDELSVPPAAVLPLRKLIRSLDLSGEPET